MLAVVEELTSRFGSETQMHASAEFKAVKWLRRVVRDLRVDSTEAQFLALFIDLTEKSQTEYVTLRSLSVTSRALIPALLTRLVALLPQYRTLLECASRGSLLDCPERPRLEIFQRVFEVNRLVSIASALSPQSLSTHSSAYTLKRAVPEWFALRLGEAEASAVWMSYKSATLRRHNQLWMEKGSFEINKSFVLQGQRIPGYLDKGELNHLKHAYTLLASKTTFSAMDHAIALNTFTFRSFQVRSVSFFLFPLYLPKPLDTSNLMTLIF